MKTVFHLTCFVEDEPKQNSYQLKCDDNVVDVRVISFSF